jgi:hypothetical protein
MNIAIHYQKRKSLALKLSLTGMTGLVPYGMDPESDRVQAFLAEGVAKLPAREEVTEPLQPEDIYDLVERWSVKLDVTVCRTQLRPMRTKWGSISTAGILTLSGDLLYLPLELVEYVVVHELLHLKFPDHRQGWRVSMGMYLPDWREQEYRLQAYVVRKRE